MATRIQRQAVAQRQQRAFPEGDVSRYAGQWIAVRDGEVVASGPDIGSVRSDPAVREGDAFASIPSDPSATFLL